ncbi:MAG: class B sortase [Clostridia bacterium]|nr:class B sortase [Clostridia bacterium]
MKNKRLLLVGLCLCLLLCSCSSVKNKPSNPLVTPTYEGEVPPINNTWKFSYEGDDPKTLYEFYSENEDTIGWLTIPETKTDNIVMKGQYGKKYEKGVNGRDHYLSLDFYHNSRTAGELYVDQRCHIGYNQLPQNVTIYGHHMANGTMLTCIDRYKDKAYTDKHQYFTFHTLWNVYHYRVFAIFVIDINKKEHLDFNFRQHEFENEQAFMDFIGEVKSRSLYQTDVPIDGDDKLINLVTCTYPTGNPSVDDARLILMGRLCTDPEEIKAAEKDFRKN